MSEHITIGMDLGDCHHLIVVFDDKGNKIECNGLANSIGTAQILSTLPGGNGGLGGRHSFAVAKQKGHILNIKYL
jgi:hypothetical protein